MVDNDRRPSHRARRQGAAGRSDSQTRASRATMGLIVESAHGVLLTKGYAGFTTRAVAEAAGISQGNLAYHFKTKQDLLRAVVAHLIELYSDRLRRLLEQLDIEKSDAMDQLVRYLWNDTTSENVVRVFRELWAIALDDAVVKDAIDDFYDEVMEDVVESLRRYYPNANIDSLRESVHLLTIISEGTSVLYGTRSDRAVSGARMIRIASQVLDAVAKGEIR
jgi:AcrR family transcriptional regulator